MPNGLFSRSGFERRQFGAEGVAFGLSADDTRMADEFQPALVGVIHEDERDAIIPADIPDADILAVAAKIGEAEGSVIQHFEEARRAAAMLDIGPAGFRDAG